VHSEFFAPFGNFATPAMRRPTFSTSALASECLLIGTSPFIG